MAMGDLYNQDPYGSGAGMDFSQFFQNPQWMQMFQNFLPGGDMFAQAPAGQGGQPWIPQNLQSLIPMAMSSMRTPAASSGIGMARKMFNSPGIPADVRRMNINERTQQAKAQGRSVTNRFRTSQAGRGFLNSGLTGKGEMDIADSVLTNIQNATNALDMEDARLRAANRQAAVGAMSGLAGAEATRNAAGIQGGLGLGQLNLNWWQAQMERMMNELGINLGIQDNYFGYGGG